MSLNLFEYQPIIGIVAFILLLINSYKFLENLRQFSSARNVTFEEQLKARNYVEIAPKDFSWDDFYYEVNDRLARVFDTHELHLAFTPPGNEERENEISWQADNKTRPFS